MNVKQIRLRLIDGVDSEGALAYSEAYNLCDKTSIKILRNLLMKKGYLYGFLVETSSFNEGTYNKENGENEFRPFIEVIYAEDNIDSFKFINVVFNKMSYHVTKGSILEVRNDLIELLINAKYSENDLIDYANRMLKYNGGKKKVKKAFKF